jgi:hypothetical protein
MSSDYHPSPATLRLMGCVEAFAHEEEGAIGHDDWAGLAGVLRRELAVLQKLAMEKIQGREALAPRVRALHDRYERLSQRIATAQARDAAELAQLCATAQRANAVRATYLKA